MSIQFDAVYEGGVLRPLQPLDLPEHELVIVSVTKATEASAQSSLDLEYTERLKLESAEDGPVPGLEEVRKRLAGISGSMAEQIVSARGDR